jgi:hypothetical protein
VATNTVLNPPQNATACLIVPPLTSTNPKYIKGIAGDTGIQIHASNPTLVSIPSNLALPQTIVINAQASEVIDFWWL